jgi:polyphosphate kinase 2 (PPK2 family)
VKFFLHVSKKEQRERLLARLDEPAKRWKFELGDIAERKLWDKYMAAYEDMIRATSREEAPWYVVPADNKPFARLVVSAALIETLASLDLRFPKVGGKALAEMKEVRAALLAEGQGRDSKSGKD